MSSNELIRFMVSCTIAIPVFNRERMIRHALDSALAQRAPNLEILVVDNCSTDRTWEVLQSYKTPHLRLVRNDTNLGLFGNFNRCLDLAQGKYLRFLCSDDILSPDCLETEMRLMEANPTVALLTTRGRRVDTEGKILGLQADHFPAGIYDGREAILAILWFHAHYAYNPLNYPSGVLLRRDAALHAGTFDMDLRMTADIDFFLRVLDHGDLAVSDSVGCTITIHGAQEGVHLTSGGDTIREILGLTRRYAPRLRQRGTYDRIMQQLTAYALGLSFKYWRQRAFAASRTHLQMARASGIGWMPSLAAILRLLSLRLMLRATGRRVLPLQPRKCRDAC